MPSPASSPVPDPPASNGFDLVFKSARVDEFEDMCTRMITKHIVTPFDKTAGTSAVHLHGAGQIAALSLTYGQGLELDCTQVEASPDAADDTRLGFTMALSGAGLVTLEGVETVATERVGVMLTATQPKTFQFQAGSVVRSLLLDGGQIARHCADILGHPLDRDLRFESVMSLETGPGQGWAAAMGYAFDELGNIDSLTRTIPSVRQQFEQMMLVRLLYTQPHTYTAALLRPQSPAAPFYVKRAEAFIEASADQPLSLSDIAAHAGVSARSLQTGFQSFRRTTPMAFLRRVRLERAHAALLAADPARDTVVGVALSVGFTHMGEFAKAYRQAYGVAPSHTLARGF